MNSGCFASNQYVKPHITQESLPARSIRTWVSLHVALPVAVHFDAIPLLMLFATGHPWACWSGMVLALVKYRIAYILSLHTSEQKLAAYRTCAGSNMANVLTWCDTLRRVLKSMCYIVLHPVLDSRSTRLFTSQRQRPSPTWHEGTNSYKAIQCYTRVASASL